MVRLTPEQVKSYKENGYIIVKNIFSERELAVMIEEYDKLFKSKNQDVLENSWVGDSKSNRVTNSPYTVKGIHNMQYHNAVFGRMLYNDNLLDAVADCMGSENIKLHHTKAHFKPPEKGGLYPMHQDYHYFPFKNDSMMAVFIHLDAAFPENGGLFVYPGSHLLGPQEDVGAREGNFHYVDNKKFPLEKATPVIADRGDVVIFSYLLIHGSPLNTSQHPRRMYLIQVAEATDTPVGEQKVNPGYGWMLRGVNVDKDASIAKQHDYD